MEKKYLVTCNPLMDGTFIHNICGLDASDIEEIEEKCMSISPHDDSCLRAETVAICPLKDENTAISITIKKTSKAENRPHPVTQGKIVPPGMLNDLLQKMLVSSFKDELYYELDENDMPIPCCTEKSDEPVNFHKPCHLLSGHDRLAFFYSLIDIIKKDKKIKLIVSEEEKHYVQAIIYLLLPIELSTQMFTISNGECCQNPPFILLNDEIYIQKDYEYTEMDLDEFLENGKYVISSNSCNDLYSYINDYIIHNINFYCDNLYRCYKIRKKYFKKHSETDNSFEILSDYNYIFSLFKSTQSNMHRLKNENVINRLIQLTDSIDSANHLLLTEFPTLSPIKPTDGDTSVDGDTLTDTVDIYDMAFHCKWYILSGDNKYQQQFSYLRKYFFENEEYQKNWDTFQKEIQNMLSDIKSLKSAGTVERYVQVLCLAFQYTPDGRSAFLAHHVLTPYDFSSMKNFLISNYKSFQRKKIIKAIQQYLVTNPDFF